MENWQMIYILELVTKSEQTDFMISDEFRNRKEVVVPCDHGLSNVLAVDQAASTSHIVQPIHQQVGSPLHYPPTCEVMEWELEVKKRAKGQGERDSQNKPAIDMKLPSPHTRICHAT